MTATGPAYHRNGTPTEFRLLYAVAALYLAVTLSVFGSYLIARDLTRDLFGAGSPAPSVSYPADHGPHQLKSGASDQTRSPAGNSGSKRLRGIETKDGLGKVMTVALSRETPAFPPKPAATAPKPVSAGPRPAGHTFSYALLQRPPPAN